MNSLIGFMGALGLQIIFVALYIATVLQIKHSYSKGLPILRGYAAQIRGLLRRTRHADPTTHHFG